MPSSDDATKSNAQCNNKRGTQFSFDEHISQGFGVYVLVIFNYLSTAALLAPNITGTYAPTPFSTGACADP